MLHVNSYSPTLVSTICFMITKQASVVIKYLMELMTLLKQCLLSFCCLAPTEDNREYSLAVLK